MSQAEWEEAELHPLLKRQIKRHKGDGTDLIPLMKAVSDSYLHFDRSQELVENSARHSARELEEANAKLLGLNDELEERVKERTNSLKNAMEEAQRASSAKSLFLAKMSHELRTPLNAIIGFCELLTEELSEQQLDPQHMRYLQNIRSNGHHLTRMISDVLVISRIEAGKTSLNLSQVSLQSLSEDIQDAYRLEADSRGIEFHCHYDSRLPERIISDESKLRQMVSNLLSNAMKFTPEGELVALSFKQKPRSKNTLLISVRDTGIGIDEENLEIIFKGFEQSDNSITRDYGGTGLGLAITSEFAHLFGGTVSVQSKKGSGSTFTIEVPFRSEKAIKKEAVKEGMHLSFGHDVTILLVEDNPTNVELMQSILRSLHIKNVVHAKNGRQAVEMVTSAEPDLILMDIHMPTMDGIEATRQIRGMDSERAQLVPIIACTADAFSDARRDALAAGMNDFILKPIQTRDLVGKLKCHINGIRSH